MTDLLEALEEQGAGLLISVDEVQPSLDEMIQLVAVYQLLIQEGRKVALLMAGLPHNVAQIMQDKSVSFVRRAQTVHLGNLADYEVETATRRTVESSGRTVNDDALAIMVSAAAGFPFMVQLVGYRTWDVNPERPAITRDDAQEGMELARREFESRIILSTYLGLSNGDKLFLRALAECGEPCHVSDVARLWGKTTSYAAQYKRRLLEQGVIEERIDGSVVFAIPFMREFVRSVSFD